MKEFFSGWIRCVIITCSLLVVLLHSTYGQEKTALKENQDISQTHQTIVIAGNQKREGWIREKVDQLSIWSAASGDTLYVNPQVTRYEDVRKVSYRIADQGSIHCKNGDIIRIVLHSSHTNKEIGDVALGIDNYKRVFLNSGHVCGGIVHFESKDDVLPLSADDFFARFISDTDDEKWQPWKGK